MAYDPVADVVYGVWRECCATISIDPVTGETVSTPRTGTYVDKLNASTGDVLARWKVSDAAGSPVSYDYGNRLALSPDSSILYVGLSNGDGVIALRASDGSILHRASAYGDVRSLVYVTSLDRVVVLTCGSSSDASRERFPCASLMSYGPDLVRSSIPEITLKARPWDNLVADSVGNLFVASSWSNQLGLVEAQSMRPYLYFDVEKPTAVEPVEGSRDGTYVVASGGGFRPSPEARILQYSLDARRKLPLAPLKAPSLVKGSAEGVDAIKVRWRKPPGSEQSGVLGYRAVARPGGRSCVAIGTFCTIRGLSGGKAYRISVQARNRMGWGPSSKAVRASTPRPQPIPVPQPTPTPVPTPFPTPSPKPSSPIS
jgi:hypothetical protein